MPPAINIVIAGRAPILPRREGPESDSAKFIRPGIFMSMTQSAMRADEARRVLKQTFGFDGFRPGQEEVVSALLAGEHVLTVMPTGAGKSLCFQIPALVLGGLTIVVSPLVALMEDQVAALKLAGVAAETINSARPRPDNVAVWHRVTAGEVRLLYLAPERLMTAPMLAALSKLPVRLIAIDEAHCISRWGPAFRPEYEALSSLRTQFPDVPIAALTATADPATRDDISARLYGGPARAFVSGFDRPNIQLAVCERESWKRQLLAFVQERQGDSGIVYCLSRRMVEEAALFLQQNDVPALAYHAGLDAALRSRHQDRFMTESGLVMVATIAFGMGIDKPDLRYVFHVNLPGSMEAYYQEIGRAGRDGAPAEAHMLFSADDIRMRRMFIDNEDTDSDHKQREHRRLDLLIAYAEAPECRREALLRYFGDAPVQCGNCDNCLDPPRLSDGTALAQQCLAAVEATGQRFGAAHIVDVLCGADTQKVRDTGHDRLAIHGAGRGVAKPEWRGLVRQMLAADLLSTEVAAFGGLAITAKGARLMAGQGEFHYRPPRRQRQEKAPRSQRGAEDLGEADAQLFAALKRLRLELAQTRGVPAYAVFPDRSLIDMTRRKPSNSDEFAMIHGVGAAKLRDFATPFLTVIGEFVL